MFIDGCPHHETAVERLREAARLAEVDLVIEQHRVADAADAQRLGFGGSPTILIDGRDLFPAPRVVDMACRLYASPDRRMAGAPSVGQLVELLRQRLAPA
ncbi:thioredoxin family protein [Nostocoides sp. HKS02]|uniref:thioredoxin family protein n=1 Tax=Nostocoides sp. HKS02 TaxID=1813880 RepID=UPI0012B47623|nr:thioredoxin family protein [Tetrasphaera sp. HKS02]QGN58073.1 thioredoxin family protein [Tetrasphaera sp. HKS02]